MQNELSGRDHDKPEADLVVIGAGPGGYTAAFRAADLGLQVTLIERYSTLGGVCLNVGCIPSKALLHIAGVVYSVHQLSAQGVEYGEPRFNLSKIRQWKGEVVGKLTEGLANLAKRRGVRVITGVARFEDAHHLLVSGPDRDRSLSFGQAIIAIGSRAVALPDLPYGDSRLMESTDALELPDVPERLLVIGGGIIGLEMAAVFDALGSRVTVVEALDEVMVGADRDVVAPLQKACAGRYEAIYTSTRVVSVSSEKDGLLARFEGKNAPDSQTFDRVLVAVGRCSNGSEVAANLAGVEVDEKGFIPVNEQQRTNVPHIFAIGDVVGEPMLAHKATHEGKVAAEVAAGLDVIFNARAIPSVAYTDPEVAWMGLTETKAREDNIAIKRARFPWSASGRALGIGRTEGMTKLIFDKENGHLLGAAIVGPGAGDLIAETLLGFEMGADAEDIALTIHPHPTLSETIGFSGEIAEGTITDLYLPKR